MIKLPDEKQALIEWLKPQIAELENICDEIPFGLDEDDAMQLKVMRFALDCINATAQAVSDGCKWSFDDDGYWESACGSTWVFNDGGPIENQCNFCQKCGDKVVLAAAPGGQDD